MKKILFAIAAVLGLGSVASCSDMLDTESTSQVFDPALNSKTDSVFYAEGIFQAMQEVADQYVFQGEMRGDLVAINDKTDSNLVRLFQFEAQLHNKYDSAYRYYRIINNCNYYLAHRDTTLLTASEKIALPEYRGIMAIRAWAYLQLARNYGRVPFFTEPLTEISQIDRQYEKLDIYQIVDRLAPQLQQFSGLPTPASRSMSLGSTTWGSDKTADYGRLFIPVDVMLGDMYLETNQYEKAVQAYTTYFTKVADVNQLQTVSEFYAPFTFNASRMGDLPADFEGVIYRGNTWNRIFNLNDEKKLENTDDIVTYIPMATNRLRGATTLLPLTFGFNFYSASTSRSDLTLEDVQVVPSANFKTMSDTADYYYFYTPVLPNNQTPEPFSHVSSRKWGDTRFAQYVRRGSGEDSTKYWIQKYQSGNVLLYRTSTVLLHLAEAYNRLGYPDAAFLILKDGLSSAIITTRFSNQYLKPATLNMLQTLYGGILSRAHLSQFPSSFAMGIHSHGAGQASDLSVSGSSYTYYVGMSPYRLDTVAGLKMAEIQRLFPSVQVGTTLQDTINAVEDLICDEYALELAYEGSRFYDLTRLARHKNTMSPSGYGGNFGSVWLGQKLAIPGRNRDAAYFLNEQNWYLPFQ